MSAYSVTDPKLYWKQAFHTILSSPLRTEDTETTIQRYVELLLAWIETIQNAMLLLRGYKVVQIRSCWSLFLLVEITGKNSGFPILDILGYLKNTHKNPKFGRMRQIPIWELGWEFPDWDLSHSPKFGILWVFFKYPKISKIGNPLSFPVYRRRHTDPNGGYDQN